MNRYSKQRIFPDGRVVMRLTVNQKPRIEPWFDPRLGSIIHGTNGGSPNPFAKSPKSPFGRAHCIRYKGSR